MSKKGQYVGGHTVVGPRSNFFVHKSKKDDAQAGAKDRAATQKGERNREKAARKRRAKDLVWLSANDKPRGRK